MFKRISLFLLTNIAVIAIGMLALNLLGIGSYITETGLDYKNLFFFALIFGFTGSIFSLLISKKVAKWTTGAVVIENPRSEAERWLKSTVERMAKDLNIKTPEIAIYESSDVNAFATGYSKNNSLVAVSTGLLNHLSVEEIEAVIGHEMAHINNGDMVTMTLLQGVMNTFVIFLSRVIGYFIDRVIFKNESGQGIGYMITVFILDLVLGFLAAIITSAFSRYREYKADEGGARLTSPKAMKSALLSLEIQHEASQLPAGLKAFGINGGLSSLFSTHPPIKKRVKHLEDVFN